MHDVTQILSQIADGDAQAASQLLPLVYDELRRLAAARVAKEGKALTLDATALVHEAYLRLVGPVEKDRIYSASCSNSSSDCVQRVGR